MADPALHRRHRIILALKWLATLLVIGFLVHTFRGAWQEALTQDPHFSLSRVDLRWLVLCGLCYFASLVPMALYWWRLNAAFGQEAGLLRTLTAYYTGHLGKYVPGKGLPVALRTALMKEAHSDATLIAASAFIETLLMMAVGAAIAALLLAVLFPQYPGLAALAAFLALGFGLPTLPPLTRRALRRVHPAARRQEVETALGRYGWRLLGTGVLLEAAGWSLMGFSLWCAVRALPLPDAIAGPVELWPRLTASVSLSTVAGFVSMLPGGLGVRELVLDQLLQEPFGNTYGHLSAIVLRIIWLLTEVLASIILYMGLQWQRRT